MLVQVWKYLNKWHILKCVTFILFFKIIKITQNTLNFKLPITLKVYRELISKYFDYTMVIALTYLILHDALSSQFGKVKIKIFQMNSIFLALTLKRRPQPETTSQLSNFRPCKSRLRTIWKRYDHHMLNSVTRWNLPWARF